MSDCIFGIKCNGVSIQINQISIEEDQSKFDYICNVSLSDSWNGNGTYNISIVNKDLVQGFPVGKWRIIKAYIAYDWGKSTAKFIMTDENGIETQPITASRQCGSASSYGFDTNTLARSIFPKAQMVVSEYPSAPICDAIMELENERLSYSWKYINDEYNKNNRDAEHFIELISYASSKIINYVELYKTVKNKLEECDDERAKQLLIRITNQCKELLCSLPLRQLSK